jgi:hypothetical protein
VKNQVVDDDIFEKVKLCSEKLKKKLRLEIGARYNNFFKKLVFRQRIQND